MVCVSCVIVSVWLYVPVCVIDIIVCEYVSLCVVVFVILYICICLCGCISYVIMCV